VSELTLTVFLSIGVGILLMLSVIITRLDQILSVLKFRSKEGASDE
jgi:hypothetical protein